MVRTQLSWQISWEADFALFRGQWAVPWRQATGAFVKIFGLKTNYGSRWVWKVPLLWSLSTWGHLPSLVLGPLCVCLLTQMNPVSHIEG